MLPSPSNNGHISTHCSKGLLQLLLWRALKFSGGQPKSRQARRTRSWQTCVKARAIPSTTKTTVFVGLPIIIFCKLPIMSIKGFIYNRILQEKVVLVVSGKYLETHMHSLLLGCMSQDPIRKQVLFKKELHTSTPQLPFLRPQIPSNRDHMALHGRTLGGLGRSLQVDKSVPGPAWHN